MEKSFAFIYNFYLFSTITFIPLKYGGGGALYAPPFFGFLPFAQNIFKQPIPENFFQNFLLQMPIYIKK